MAALITPEDLPRWVPGDLTIDSAACAWAGMRLRGYRYAASDVFVPPLQDYIIVAYKEGVSAMHRRCDGAWQSEQVGPGVVSLLTQAVQSHWRWTDPVSVSHIYISPADVASIASDVFQRDVETVELFDVLKVEDPVLSGLAGALEHEAREGGLGGALYVDALKRQACIHILRRYADVAFREPTCHGGLSRVQCRMLTHYVEDHIGETIALADLAAVTRLSVSHFVRKFGAEFGFPPHVYVMRRRLEHAKAMLAKPGIPLKVVAADSGFSDQSHMTRLFRRTLNLTPAEYRRLACPAC